MTTQTYVSFLDNTSTAGFRQWGSELGVNLALAGLVQTADTGQINWTTVTLPGVNVVAGYEIWRFADSSLFLKFEFASGSSAAVAAIFVTVGTGSNGSGTITGQTNTRATWTSQSATSNTTTNYTTYISRTADSLSICWKSKGIGVGGLYPAGYLIVGKTVDNTGSPTTTGFGVVRLATVGANPSLQTVRTVATAATFADSAAFIVYVGGVTSSLDAGNFQTYLTWLNVPTVVPFEWCSGYIQAEIPQFNQFTTALVASVNHTYLTLGLFSGTATINGQSNVTYSLAMIYE